MENAMENAMESAIKLLAVKGGGAEKSDDAMKFTQAALNLAHVAATLDTIKNPAGKVARKR